MSLGGPRMRRRTFPQNVIADGSPRAAICNACTSARTWAAVPRRPPKRHCIAICKIALQCAALASRLEAVLRELRLEGGHGLVAGRCPSAPVSERGRERPHVRVLARESQQLVLGLREAFELLARGGKCRPASTPQQLRQLREGSA